MNKRLTNYRLFVLVITLALLFLFDRAVYASTVEETFKKRIDFQPGGYLELENENGSIEISSWDKAEVEIVAYIQVHAGSRARAEELMNDLKIKVTNTTDEIRIETTAPHSLSSEGGFFNWLFGGIQHSFSVEYEIRVPREIDLNIHTTNGKIICEHIQGRLRLHSTNGKINARDISGMVRSKTTNGSMTIEMISIPADEEINFSTTNGSINLYLPDNYSAKVDLKTTNGHIDTDFPLTVQKTWSRQHVLGMIGDGSGTLYCNTTNGNIKLSSTGNTTDKDFSL